MSIVSGSVTHRQTNGSVGNLCVTGLAGRTSHHARGVPRRAGRASHRMGNAPKRLGSTSQSLGDAPGESQKNRREHGKRSPARWGHSQRLENAPKCTLKRTSR